MTAFAVAAAALAVLAAALLVRPLWTGGVAGGSTSALEPLRAYSVQLSQLGELHRAGALSDDQYAQSKATVQGKLLASLGDGSEHTLPAAGPSPRLAVALALFLFAFAAGGYAWLGSPASLAFGPGSGASAMAASGQDDAAESAAAAPHALAPERVGAMVDQLAKLLKEHPDDVDGWLMLARSLVVLGKHDQAVDAFKEAARLHPDDPALLADYADALAVARGRRLDGEPTRLVEHALEVDPVNAKALALAGSAAFDRRDYASAVRYWEKLVEIAPDDPFAQQIRGGIAEARDLGGISPAAAPASEAASGSAKPAAVSGTVVLAPSLRGRTAPDDIVFVFARAADGSRMPLAILRKRAGDLPLQFTLDDSLAMSDSAKLSSVKRVVVSARISKSGNATAQPGDLQGSLGDIDVGSSGLHIEINQEVAK